MDTEDGTVRSTDMLRKMDRFLYQQNSLITSLFTTQLAQQSELSHLRNNFFNIIISIVIGIIFLFFNKK